MAKGESGIAGGGYLVLLRRRWAWVATILPVALLGSVYLAFALPAEYRSTATIILESATVQKDLIQASVVNYADQQIEIISGRVMTLATLQGLVREYDPYPGDKVSTVPEKAQRILEDMELERVDPVTGLPLDKSSAFAVHYKNPDPNRAAAVTNRLADLFLSYHQRVRNETAKTATEFIETQADSITKELVKLDQEYAQLRTRYGQAMPDENARNQESRDRADRDLDSVERELRVAQERESLLTIQLNGLSPNLMANKGDLTDLATVKAQLADAEQRYTPDHPDVKRLRRALASLMAQGNRGGLPASVHADNPEYLRVASELDSARKEVAALRGRAAKTREQIDTYSGFLRRSPDVEREYSALQRRRESLQSQYLQVQEKLKSARLGQVFEAGNQGEHFSMIRAPVASPQPFSPNRIGIILLGLALGCATLAAALAIAESTDATVRGSDDLSAFESVALLGVIPEMFGRADLHRRNLIWGSVSVVYVIALLFVAGTIYRAEARLHQTKVDMSHESKS